MMSQWWVRRQGRIADQLTRMDFIILDELGYLPFAQSGGQLLFYPPAWRLRPTATTISPTVDGKDKRP
jgi:DNA replication protein DnaC